MSGRKWVLPAWTGPDSPQSPVPADDHAAQREAWKRAQAAQRKQQRNRRGKRPPPPITGIRRAT